MQERTGRARETRFLSPYSEGRETRFLTHLPVTPLQVDNTSLKTVIAVTLGTSLGSESRNLRMRYSLLRRTSSAVETILSIPRSWVSWSKVTGSCAFSRLKISEAWVSSRSPKNSTFFSSLGSKQIKEPRVKSTGQINREWPVDFSRKSNVQSIENQWLSNIDEWLPHVCS